MNVKNLPVKDLMESRTNPRKIFDDEELQALAVSIGAHGILVPLIVREVVGSAHEIVAGARRYRAAKIAGLATVPCVIVDYDEILSMEAQLIENVQRKQLHPLDEAEGYQKLLAAGGYKVEFLAMRIGKTAPQIWALLKYLDLAPEQQELFRKGVLTRGQATALARLPQALQKDASRRVRTEGLTGEQANIEYRDTRLALGSTRSKPRPGWAGKKPVVRRMMDFCKRKNLLPWEMRIIEDAVAKLEAGEPVS